ncbi:MAG: hypothetical protein S4CHLAM6_01930 [Chlamydiae bacterium]|nr:hypothetical protein [Chlamydiota bacterium]
MEEVTKELFLREQLMQREMALEQEQIEKSQLIQRLTEDFKKPVEQLIQFSNIALVRMEREELRKASSYLAEMKMISEDLLIYLNDLREIAMLKSGESKFTLGEIDIKAVLKLVKKKFQPIANSSQIKLSFFMQPGGTFACGDEHKLIKVISILVSRMLHDLDHTGTVKIKVVQKNDNIEICIVDNKPFHFDKKMLEQIYFKFDGPQSERSMPGLNLSVCKELMVGQKGNVEIFSDENETRFLVTLPVSKDF